MLKRHRKPFKKRPMGYRIAAVLVIVALLLSVFALDRHVIPLIEQYARSRAQWYATRMINEAVTAVLADNSPRYERLVTVSRDAEGNVTSVEADVQVLNQLKAALSLEVARRAGEERQITVSIPLGTFLGSHLFTGRGPVINIPVGANVSVLSDFESAFAAAGINQTSHRIILQVKTTVFLAVPTARTCVEVDSSFIIAESILLGEVPDAYTVVENIDEETVGEIFDYGAEIQN